MVESVQVCVNCFSGSSDISHFIKHHILQQMVVIQMLCAATLRALMFVAVQEDMLEMRETVRVKLLIGVPLFHKVAACCEFLLSPS